MTAPASAAASAPRRVRKREVIPALLTAALVGFAAFLYVRGTRTSEPVTPRSAVDGLIRQVVAGPEGRKEVRGAAVLDYAPAEVFAVVTDYAHFGEIFADRLFKLEIGSVTTTAAGTQRITGELRSSFATVPLGLEIRHVEAGGDRVAAWDEASGDRAWNRGSWKVSPVAGGGALLVYTIDARVPGYPDFLVRNALLHELKPVFAAIRRRLDAGRAAAAPGG